MVGSCDVKFPIRLEALVLAHQQFSSYEPELFPGLIYRYYYSLTDYEMKKLSALGMKKPKEKKIAKIDWYQIDTHLEI